MNPLRRYRASSPEGGALCAVEEKKTFCLQEKLADSQGKSSPFGGADIAQRWLRGLLGGAPNEHQGPF
jgi:hypothetical protein